MAGLEQEISQLRRGRGVMSADLRERLGPTLDRALALAAGPVIRAGVTRRLIHQRAELVSDLIGAAGAPAEGIVAKNWTFTREG